MLETDAKAPEKTAPKGGSQARLLAASLQEMTRPQTGGLCLAAAQLVSRHLRFDAADPLWADRDRVVAEPELAGLAAALSELTGTDALCSVQAPAIGCGVGLALAERMLAARFGRSLVDHRCWVLCTAASLVTGPVQEAAWLAGAWRLGRLTILASSADDAPPGLAGFAAAGWAVRRACAADGRELAATLSAALRALKPTLILCTGSVAPMEEQGDAGPGWAAAGRNMAGIRRAWLKRLARHASKADFETALGGRLHGRWHTPLSEPGPLLQAEQMQSATAQTVRAALAALPGLMPELAVLPGAPGWPVPPGQAEPPAASNAISGALTYGMGAALCGLALHGGLMPLAAEPLDAADALLPGLRAAGEAGVRLVQVLIEPTIPCPASGRRAALRAMTNLFVFRPADASEALECLELAIRRTAGPSVLLLSDSARPLLADRPGRTRSARGGYVAAEAPGARAATLVASGQELAVALDARTLLIRRGISVAVVSLPCWDLFALQEETFRQQVLGGAPRIGLEAGCGLGWHRWLGPRGLLLSAWDTPAMVADLVAGCL